MKKYLIILLISAAVFMTACSTLPEPANNAESLVSGSFVIDFPDGFHGGPKETIDSNLTIKIYNRTTGKDHAIRTDKGYFSFIANAGDEMKIYEYYYKRKRGRTTSTMGGQLNKVFTVIDNKINYLGHIKMTYTAGNVSGKEDHTTYFHYNKNMTIKYDNNAVENYLNEEIMESEWLKDDYEVVKYNR